MNTVKEGNSGGHCIICNGTQDLKIIYKVYKNFGMSISYADLLVKCFYIQFLDKHFGKDNMLCMRCIKSIKFCITFRKRVETAHKKLYKINPEVLGTSNYPNDKNFKSHNYTNHEQLQKRKTECDDYVHNDDKLENNQSMDCSDNNADDDNQESDSSVKTVEILRATGYKDLIKKSKEKVSFAVPKLEPTQTQCPVCDKQFPDNYLLNKHHAEHFPAFICHVCGMSFTREYFYKKHLMSHSESKFPCDMCDRKYNTHEAMYTHRKIFHFNYHPFVCYHCDMRFRYGLLKKKHMLSVHGIKSKMFKCPKCDEEFYTSNLMENHLKKKHLKFKDHQCVACSSAFYSARDLKKHILVKHEGVRNHLCDICNKRFSYSRDLRVHRKIHLNQKDHVCQLCGAAFVQHSSLKYHLKTHHKEAQ